METKPGILVVEENIELAFILVAIFRREGFLVFEAQTYDQAVAVFQQNQSDIDLVSLDHSLGNEKTGAQLLTELREIIPALPAIVYTAVSTTLLNIEYPSDPAPKFFQKPTDLKTLTVAARELAGVA